MTARSLDRIWPEPDARRDTLLERLARGVRKLRRSAHSFRRFDEAGPTDPACANFPALSIRNSAGVPGTAGFLATLRRTGETVLVTNHHILFARGGEAGQPVIAVAPQSRSRARTVGTVLHGKAGIALGSDPPIFVDAAAIRLEAQVAQSLSGQLPERTAVARPGEKVFKDGAATGVTHGLIIDIAYPDQWHFEYRSESAPGQILIRPIEADKPFSGAGDSGAAIRNEQGEIVALLWGTTARGEGVASPIGAVAAALGLAFAKPARTRPS